MEKVKCFVSCYFFSLDKIPKIKICHMVVKEHTEVIEGRRSLIAVDVIDSEEAAEDASFNHGGADFDKEDGSGLLGAGVTEEVEDMQKYLKASSISSYMLKHYNLLTHGFENNIMAQEKILKYKCNFGAKPEWREGRRVVCSYLDVETTKDKFFLLNPATLDCIPGYIMEDSVGKAEIYLWIYFKLLLHS